MTRKKHQSLVHAFLDTTSRNPGRPALLFKEKEQWKNISFTEYRSRALSVAAFLHDSGINAGERIAILSNNRPDWIIADMGLLSQGCVSVPIYPTLMEDQIRYILGQSGTRGVFVENRDQFQKLQAIMDDLPEIQFIAAFDPVGIEMDGKLLSFSEILKRGKAAYDQDQDGILERANKVKRDDLASIVYTSGTTGKPKGVMLSHGNFISNAESVLERYDIGEDDLSLSILPLSHVLERLGSFITCFTLGGSQYAFVESLETVAADINSVRPTIFIAVPRLFEKIHAKIMNQVQEGSGLKKSIFNWAVKTGGKYQRAKREGTPGFFLEYLNRLAYTLVHKKVHEKFGGRIRYIISGGAPLEPRINDFFIAIGLPLREGYGLTETSPVTNLNTISEYRIGSVGKLVPNVEIKICDDGEILVKGPNVMIGYYGDPDATKEAFTDDGWFKTGDIGKVDEDGYLWITDRKKEILVTSGGKNVAPQPIENLLKQCPVVSQVMIIGDKRNFVSALIVPDFDHLNVWASRNNLSDLTVDDLLNNPVCNEYIQKELAEIVSSLPKYEQVKKYILLKDAWSVESGELTPTMKIKRRQILEKHTARIEELYRS